MQSSKLECQMSLLRRLGLDVSEVTSLHKSAKRSAEAIKNAQTITRSNSQVSNDWDLVAFGSLARYELTPNSDLDYLIVTSDNNSNVPLSSELLDELCGKMVPGSILNRPGSTGIFGKEINAKDLTSNIGLQRDTNEILTRRILYLEESVSLANSDFHEKVLRKIIGTYLDVNREEGKIPRFLLNDIIRYWRTIAIDYSGENRRQQAKSAPSP